MLMLMIEARRQNLSILRFAWQKNWHDKAVRAKCQSLQTHTWSCCPLLRYVVVAPLITRLTTLVCSSSHPLSSQWHTLLSGTERAWGRRSLVAALSHPLFHPSGVETRLTWCVLARSNCGLLLTSTAILCGCLTTILVFWVSHLTSCGVHWRNDARQSCSGYKNAIAVEPVIE